VFEIRVLRRIFGPKRDEMTVCWTKLLLYQQLSDLYPSPGVNRINKPRRMR
jgi:hypothetical protein